MADRDELIAPDYLPPHVQRDWNAGDLGPIERCGECWQTHPVYLDCQIHTVIVTPDPGEA